VALILQKQGYSRDVVIAGLLHDTVEDTSVTLEDIEREFGSKVAALVKGCSEPDRSASWEIRKQHTIDYIRTAPYDIKLVVCADKLHNVSCLLREYKKIGDRVWERFNRGYEQQKWYHTSMVDSLFFGLDGIDEGSIFYQYREKVVELFG
ncbi:MAG: bifunctional (p)ppGpp synthetase/guanosine-3',5'-bis(diphosphate) 3'-pyrophosphohydrolase, partial [Calditrichaeota bacterium]|nr:bifunctional (p)ppGpp synthetase/guanosine-3',5'-bis(diphosphate) 3'-pyrophosphohydrolase [Calditrichota bacterium]